MTATGESVRESVAASSGAASPRVVVVVPTYNEAETLPQLLHDLETAIGPGDLVLVVDDNSPDGTGAVADALAEEMPFVRVLHRERKEGLGRAYEDGFALALDLGAELVVEMDADFSHRPADVPRLVEETGQAALVIGSRYVAAGSAGGLSRLRRLLSRGGSLYARVVLGLRIRDLTGGFKCFRREALERVLAKPLDSSGYAFQIETTYRVAQSGLPIVEVPISFDDRRAGTSKMRWTIAAEAFLRVPLFRLAAAWDSVRRIAADRRADWRTIGIVWLLSRVVVVAAAVVPVQFHLIHFKHTAQQGVTFLGPLLSWDTRWYSQIATRGYYVIPGRQSDVAFFPLYPTVLHVLRISGTGMVWLASALSTVVFLPALVLLYELVRSWLPRRDALRAAVYLAIFPLGFVFSMPYPEALVLMLIGATAVAAASRRYLLALVLGALAGLGRPEACFLVLPLALMVRRTWPGLSQRERVWALSVAGGPLAGIGGFVLYQWVRLQAPFAYESAQSGWGRHLRIQGIYTAAAEVWHATRIHDQWLWRDAAFVLIFLGCLFLAARARVPWPWLVAAAAIVLLPVESGSFTSVPRFGLLAPPLFAGLAFAGRGRVADAAIKVASLGALVAFTATIPLHWP